MNVTVILCTYNRCQSLAKALESLSASVMPPNREWEVVVVDNNSKDATPQVATHFCELNPARFRYLFESKQGKSFALNTAIRASRGDILAFVDDDVTVEQNWLHNLTACLQDREWAGAGGRILPPKDFSPPSWLALEGPWSQGGVVCAQFDMGDFPVELKDAVPYGTNMAFRKEMFETHGHFRVDLGPRPGSEIRNEDTEFGQRLLIAGERLRYEPSAVVYHSILEERLNKRFIREWWFAYGRSRVREKGLTRATVWGIPRYYLSLPSTALRVLLPQVMRWLSASNPHKRFRLQCTAWVTAGVMAETWSQALSRQVVGSKNSAAENSAGS